MNIKLADEIKVALVTGACIILNALIFKKIFHVQPDFLISNGPSFLFIIYIISRRKKNNSKWDKPLFWSLAIILVTLLTIGLHLT